MKALILAGGEGTRLRPLTYTRAKQLVPVANRPILHYGLDQIADAHITDVAIIVNPATGGEIIDSVQSGEAWGFRDVTYLEQLYPGGLAHAVQVARDWLGDDPFVMWLGDNLIEESLNELLDEHPPGNLVFLKHVDDPRQYGVAAVNANGRITALVEKPDDSPSNLALTGIYVLTPTIHEAISNLVPSPRGELEITDALQWLIDNDHDISYQVLDGWWIDTGKHTSVLDANRLILDRIASRVAGTVDGDSDIVGRVVIEAGAQLESCTVRGPAIIGARCSVMGSYVGPYTAIGDGCTITNTEIEHSVILDGCDISDVPRIADSLIGRGSVVEHSHTRPKALRLMLGDNTRIDIE